jgi:aminopeptidase N
VRACYAARRTLLRAAAAHCRDALHAVFEATDTCHIGSLRLSAAIERRALKAVLMELLSAADTPAAQAALARHLRVAVNPTDRLNTVAAIYRSTHPERLAILDDAYALTRTHLGAYSGYLQIVGQSPHDDVFERVALEVHRAPFSLDHPSHTRSLFVPLSLNNAQFWTPAGLAWLRETAVRIAPLSEHTTLRIIAPCQQAHAFEADLRAPVLHALRAMRARIDPVACPSVCGRLDAYLTPPA